MLRIPTVSAKPPVTRIDFYILPETAQPPEGAVMTACRLCEKATASGKHVYIHAPDADIAGALDSVLWSFRQGSFIAHERFSAGKPIEEPAPPVLIGTDEPPADHLGVMINLAPDVPPFFSRFERVLEIVDGDAQQRAQSRVRFKFYRDRGYELATHNL
jgi:DNA polymerase-3 subunit chi